MGSEEKKITGKTFLYTKVTCPICEGRGVVECCNADGKECVPVPCDRCDGKGYTAITNMRATIGAAVIVVAAAICLAVFLL